LAFGELITALAQPQLRLRHGDYAPELTDLNNTSAGTKDSHPEETQGIALCSILREVLHS